MELHAAPSPLWAPAGLPPRLAASTILVCGLQGQAPRPLLEGCGCKGSGRFLFAPAYTFTRHRRQHSILPLSPSRPSPRAPASQLALAFPARWAARLKCPELNFSSQNFGPVKQTSGLYGPRSGILFVNEQATSITLGRGQAIHRFEVIKFPNQIGRAMNCAPRLKSSCG